MFSPNPGYISCQPYSEPREGVEEIDMDLLALIAMCLAVLVFLFWGRAVATNPGRTAWIGNTNLGLALMAFALICQFTHLTGIELVNHH